MKPKAMKEAPASPKAKAKMRALKAKKVPKYPGKGAHRRNKIDDYAITKFSVTTKSAMKKTQDSNTLVSIVDANAKKHLVEQALQKLYDIDVAKVNTWVRSNGERKAYVLLTPDYDTLDAANKLGSSRLSPAD
uniref:Ribosomal protein L23/L25 N-terminal domain-containing protein n=1 Tax=Suricata suricatta TaxID=37032 RepID=A0A673VME3_SURSU